MENEGEVLRRTEIEAGLGMTAQAMGRDANSLVYNIRALPLSLVEAFIATNYAVSLDGHSHVLNIFSKMPDHLTEKLEALSARSISIITACNPYSTKTLEEDNIERQATLKRVLGLRGERWFHAKGTSKDGAWSEDSFAVLDLDYQLVEALGRTFQQHAVVFCERGSIVELVPCIDHTARSGAQERLDQQPAASNQSRVIKEQETAVRKPSPSRSGGWSWDTLPDEVRERFPPPPDRSEFSSAEDYEQARGYWQSRVGKNIGLVLQQYQRRADKM